MAEKEAKVRLSLSGGGFLSGMRSIADDVKRSGKSIGASLTAALKEPLSKGLDAVRESVKGTVGQIGGLAQTAAGLLGGISIGSGAAEAFELAEAYRVAAARLSDLSDEGVTAAEVQKRIETAAVEYKRTSQELATAMDAVREKSGNATLAMESLPIIAEAMNATGRDAQQLGQIVGTLAKKWGITEMDQVREALVKVIDVTKGGKIKFEELAEDLDELGSIAKNAGMNGMDGFTTALGIAGKIAPNVNASISEVLAGMDQLSEKMRQTSVVEGLGDAGEKASKKFWASFYADQSAVGRLRMLLEKAGQSGKLGDLMQVAKNTEFTGREERAAFEALANPFLEAFGDVKQTGKVAKDATSKGLAAFDRAIEVMSMSTTNWDEVVKKSKDTQESTAAKVRSVQEIWRQTFTDPKMIGAMAELADVAPKVVRGLASMVSIAVNHPLLSLAGFTAGKAAVSGLGAIAGSAMSKAASAGFTGLGEMIAADAAKSGKWSAAGKSVGVVAAGILAFEVGKEVANWVADLIEAKQGDVREGEMNQFNDATSLLAKAKSEEKSTGVISDKTRKALEEERDRLIAKRTPQKIETQPASYGPMGIPIMPNMMTVIGRDTANQMDSAQSKQNEELLKRVEQHLSRELKVRIVNPEQVGKGGTQPGSNGVPPPSGGAPGYAGG